MMEKRKSERKKKVQNQKRKKLEGFLSKPGKKVSINLGIKKKKCFLIHFLFISVVFIFNSN